MENQSLKNPEAPQNDKAVPRDAEELMSLFYDTEHRLGHTAALKWAGSLEREEVLIIANELRTGRQAL